MNKDKMSVTDFCVKDSKGNQIKADPFGNNIAFSCFYCCYPVLAIVREHQHGSSKENPSVCRECGAEYFVKDVDCSNEKVVIESITHGEIRQNKASALRCYPLKWGILCFLAGALVVALSCFLFAMY